jgi:hypothetical protein
MPLNRRERREQTRAGKSCPHGVEQEITEVTEVTEKLCVGYTTKLKQEVAEIAEETEMKRFHNLR